MRRAELKRHTAAFSDGGANCQLALLLQQNGTFFLEKDYPKREQQMLGLQ